MWQRSKSIKKKKEETNSFFKKEVLLFRGFLRLERRYEHQHAAPLTATMSWYRLQAFPLAGYKPEDFACFDIRRLVKYVLFTERLEDTVDALVNGTLAAPSDAEFAEFAEFPRLELTRSQLDPTSGPPPEYHATALDRWLSTDRPDSRNSWNTGNSGNSAHSGGSGGSANTSGSEIARAEMNKWLSTIPAGRLAETVLGVSPTGWLPENFLRDLLAEVPLAVQANLAATTRDFTLRALLWRAHQLKLSSEGEYAILR